MFEKLKFWKQKDDLDDFGMGEDPSFAPMGDQTGLGSPLGLPEQPEFQTEPATGATIQNLSRPRAAPSFSPQQFATRMPPPPPSFSPPQQYQQTYQQTYQQPSYASRDIDVIIAKLDGIRLQLEAVNQRLANLEQGTNQQPQKRQFW